MSDVIRVGFGGHHRQLGGWLLQYARTISSAEAARALQGIRLATRDLLEAGNDASPEALRGQLHRWLQATRLESLTDIEIDDFERPQQRFVLWAWVLLRRDGQDLCLPLHFACAVGEQHATLKLASSNEERPTGDRDGHLRDQLVQWSFATFIRL